MYEYRYNEELDLYEIYDTDEGLIKYYGVNEEDAMKLCDVFNALKEFAL